MPRWATALLRGIDNRIAQGLLSEEESPDVAAALIRHAVDAIRGPEISEHEHSQLHLVFDHALSLDPSLIFFKASKYACEAPASMGDRCGSPGGGGDGGGGMQP